MLHQHTWASGDRLQHSPVDSSCSVPQLKEAAGFPQLIEAAMLLLLECVA